MKTLISIRFAAAAVLFLLGCLGLLMHSAVVALLWFCIVAFLVPDNSPDLSDPAMRRWLLGVAIRLTIVLAMVGIIYLHPLLAADTVQLIIFHPAFVVPLGLLGLLSLFRRWRRQKGVVRA